MKISFFLNLARIISNALGETRTKWVNFFQVRLKNEKSVGSNTENWQIAQKKNYKKSTLLEN